MPCQLLCARPCTYAYSYESVIICQRQRQPEEAVPI